MKKKLDAQKDSLLIKIYISHRNNCDYVVGCSSIYDKMLSELTLDNYLSVTNNTPTNRTYSITYDGIMYIESVLTNVDLLSQEYELPSIYISKSLDYSIDLCHLWDAHPFKKETAYGNQIIWLQNNGNKLVANCIGEFVKDDFLKDLGYPIPISGRCIQYIHKS